MALVYGYEDWQSEVEETDGDGREGVYFLTIGLYETDEGGGEYMAEEVASIIHRTVGGKYPLDGPEAEKRVENARKIVRALNFLAQGEELLAMLEDAEAQVGDWRVAQEQAIALVSNAIDPDAG